MRSRNNFEFIVLWEILKGSNSTRLEIRMIVIAFTLSALVMCKLEQLGIISKS